MAARQPRFFDVDERLRALSAAGDPLGRLAAAVDFELFRPELERHWPEVAIAAAVVGRPTTLC
jgi:hypothetical protein